MLLNRTCYVLNTTDNKKTRNRYLSSVSVFQDVVFTFAQKFKSEESIKFAADVLLRWKHVQAEEEAYINRMTQTSKDHKIKAISNKIIKLMTRLTRIINIFNSNHEKKLLLKELEEEELKLSILNDNIKRKLRVHTGMEKVRTKLQADSILIEFRKYMLYNFKTGKFNAAHWVVILAFPQGNRNNLLLEDLRPVEDTKVYWSLIYSDGG